MCLRQIFVALIYDFFSLSVVLKELYELRTKDVHKCFNNILKILKSALSR